MPDLQRHEFAVAFCVDRKFFHLALFVIWQIAHLNPHRRFDFVIATQDDLAVPDWAKSHGVILHRCGPVPDGSEPAMFHGSNSTLYRLMLARELGDRYRRILYMDSDMFVEGGDINRLLDIDLGPHPIGAALDFCYFRWSTYHAEEFVAEGLPALLYFNSGFQIIDTKAYREQEVERRSFDVCKTYKKRIRLGDQTLINLALRGKFAQISPCWNWQADFMYPHFSHYHPVFCHHFITHRKPNLVSTGKLATRFNATYRHFMTEFAPEALPDLAPPPEARMQTIKEHIRMAMDSYLAGANATAVLARFPDPYQARL